RSTCARNPARSRPDTTHGTTPAATTPPPDLPAPAGSVDSSAGACCAMCACSRITCALVPLIPHPATPPPRPRPGSRPRGPPGSLATWGGGLLHCLRLGTHALPHPHPHLDPPLSPRRRLRMAEVRLDRTQPQRPIDRPVPTVAGQQRLRLDRVAQRGTGTVRL